MEFDEATVKARWAATAKGQCECRNAKCTTHNARCTKSLQWGNRGRTQDSWEADHIIPSSEGGDNSVTNCQILCWPCHEIKTSNEAKGRASLLSTLKMPK